MKSSFKNCLLSLTLGLLCTQGVQASCTNILKTELETRREENWFARNDLILATAFAAPFAVVFLPGAVIFEGAALYFKGAAMIKVSNAKKALSIYTEAANGGGRETERLMRKLKRQHPSSELSYEQLLAEIRAADAQELGCAPGTVPSKKQIISVIDTRDSQG